VPPAWQVHFEESPTLCHPFFQMVAHLVRRSAYWWCRSICVHGRASCRDICQTGTPRPSPPGPAGHLDGGNTAAIATKPAVLLDLAEYLRHIARVHSDDAALQHQAVRLAAIVADLTIPGDALLVSRRMSMDRSNAQWRMSVIRKADGPELVLTWAFDLLQIGVVTRLPAATAAVARCSSR